MVEARGAGLGRRRPGLTVGDQVDAEEEAGAADISDAAVALVQRLEPRSRQRAELLCASLDASSIVGGLS